MANQVDRRFYVYEHKDVDGKVFYIGKGSNDRAWKTSSRNSEWKGRAQNGFSVRLIKDGLLEECSLCIERMLIHVIGVENLTNLAKGGNSNSGWVPPQEYREKLSKLFKGRPMPKAAFSPEAMAKRRAKMLGRKQAECHKRKVSAALKGKAKGAQEFDFYHPDHGSVRMTCSVLRSTYGLDRNVLGLPTGRIRSTRGWSLRSMSEDIGHRSGDNHHASDLAIRTFVHPEHGSFTGTRHQFAQAHNLKMGGIAKMVRGEIKSTLGWKLQTKEPLT